MTPSRRLRIAVALATATLMLAIGAGTSLLLLRLRDVAEAGASATVDRAGRAVEGTVNRQFMAVDGVLAGLPALLGATARDGRVDPQAASRMLRDLTFQNFNFRDLLLLQPDGLPWATALAASRNRPAPVPASALQPIHQPGSVVIAGPARNPLSGEWALFFARQVVVPGHGALTAVAEVPLSLIASLLEPVAQASSLRLAIEGADGRTLFVLPHDEARFGRPATPPIGSDATPRVRTEPGGGQVLIARRSTLYHGIEVVVTHDRDLALAGWRLDRDRLLATAVGGALLLLALAVTLNATLRQRERLDAVRARARAMLENAIDHLPDGFLMFDADDRLIVCNARFRELYAETAPFVRIGMRFDELVRAGVRNGQYPTAGADPEAFVREAVAWHRSGDRPPLERLLPNGRWLLVTERRTSDGGTVGIRTDITELKRTIAALADARDAAAAAAAAKSQFLARMSHELRTPLNGVLGIAQTLAADPSLPEAARAEARTLEMAGRHLLAVANDVLDLAKVEAGRFDLHPTPTTLSELVESCVALVRPAADAKALTMTVRGDPALPDRIMADETRLRQLLLNLLSNAVKFTPAGGRVGFLATSLSAHAPWLRIEVTDTGPGVPPGARQAIFGDFVQLAGQQAAGGTGLGLAIAAHIAERMGGRIGCGDNPTTGDGTGALFWVELPLEICRPMPRVVPKAEPAATAAPGRLRVLVADDVPANLAVARALLETAGHEVHCVPDGAQAVAAVEAAGPDGFDAVLMDIMMPGMDGLEATRRIRALSDGVGRLPVLAVTASVFADDVAACREAGMDAHIAKPIERDALLTALARLAGARAATPAPAAEPSPAPLALRGLEPRLAARLDAEFRAELAAAADALRAAEGPHAIQAAAHRLAGAAATLEADRLLGAARRLQIEGGAASPDALRANLAEVYALVDDALGRAPERVAA